MAQKPKKLLDRVREIFRLKHYTKPTGKACFFNCQDDYPTQDEYLLGVKDVLEEDDLTSLRVLVGEWRCGITVWQADE